MRGFVRKYSYAPEPNPTSLWLLLRVSLQVQHGMWLTPTPNWGSKPPNPARPHGPFVTASPPLSGAAGSSRWSTR